MLAMRAWLSDAVCGGLLLGLGFSVNRFAIAVPPGISNAFVSSAYGAASVLP